MAKVKGKSLCKLVERKVLKKDPDAYKKLVEGIRLKRNPSMVKRGYPVGCAMPDLA